MVRETRAFSSDDYSSRNVVLGRFGGISTFRESRLSGSIRSVGLILERKTLQPIINWKHPTWHGVKVYDRDLQEGSALE